MAESQQPQPKKKIAIAAFIGGSYFGGSQPVAALSMAEALADLGHDITLLHVGEAADAPLTKDPWFDDLDRSRTPWPVLGIHTASRRALHYDLLIDLVGVIGRPMQEALADCSVFFARSYGVLAEIDHCIYPLHAFRRTVHTYDEIWLWDTADQNDVAAWAVIGGGKPVRRIPFFWSPAPLIAYMEGRPEQPVGALTDDTKWTVRICETNTRNSSSAILPLTILGECGRQSALSIRDVWVHNSDHIKDNAFFKQNVFAHVQIPGVAYNFVGRQRICDMAALPRQVILSHARFVGGKYALLDAAWCGIPIVHNSAWLRRLGGPYAALYYADNSIVGAVDAIKGVPRIAAQITAAVDDIRGNLLKEFGPQRLEVHKELGAAVQGVAHFTKDTLAVADKEQKTLGAVTLPPTPGNTLVKCTDTPPVFKESAAPILKVCFAFMWDSFQSDYNFFTLLLTERLKELGDPRTVVGGDVAHFERAGERPDLVIFGPFSQPGDTEPFPGVPKVFHTAEQIPLPQQFGGSTYLQLGFTRPTPDAPEVARLPLWMMSIDWWGADNDRLVNPKLIPLARCTEPVPAEERAERHRKFCAFIVTNPMNPVRNAAFHTLNAYKPVDSAGRLFNNVGPGLFAGLGGGGGELRKHEYLKDYRFCVAYENQRATGYITEKLLHAKAAGCVPIYWGAEDVGDDFDAGSFIDANGLEGDALVAAVREAEERWEEYAGRPLLRADQVEGARGAMRCVADRILAGIQPAPNPPKSITTENSIETPMAAVSEKPEFNSKTPVCFATYASSKFMESLMRWMSGIKRQAAAFEKAAVCIYLAADIGAGEYAEIEQTVKRLGLTAKLCRVPVEAPANFPDFWEPQHYGWKTWVWRDLVNDATLPAGTVVFYSDAGAFMVRLPVDAAVQAAANGVVVYEDHSQLNKYWCSAPFCEALKVSEAELALPQAFAGAITFVAGSPVAATLFEGIWKAAQERAVLAGPKWEGVHANGQPYGHRHDQSILSIYARRIGAPWRDLALDYCHESLRRTFMTGCCYYFHRGDFKQNVNFTPLIADAYVINLPRRADRLEKFRANHPKIAGRVRTWKAVDGQALTLTPHIARMFAPNDFFWKKAVMGCALSHLGVWSQLAREPGDGSLAYLVLEDDVRLAADAEVKLLVNMPKAPADWDVLYLGGVLPPNKPAVEHVRERVVAGSPWCRVKPNQVFGQRVPNAYFHFCAYAYVLSQRGARKLMDLIERHGGYYTSADHMMCNQVAGNTEAGKEFNLYFLDPMPAGCIQEDDPRYGASDFNDFSRVDNFDSDLWTNDERFTVAEVEAALAAGAPLDVPMTVLESRGVAVPMATAPAAAPVTAPVPAAPAAAPATPATPFYAMTANFKTMESDWLTELFGQPINTADIHTLTVGKPIPHTPICIVQKPHIDFWQSLFTVWSALGQQFYAIHISDEYATKPDSIAWYSLPNCKGVIRNYPRTDIPADAAAKVITVPLGYATGRAKTAAAAAQSSARTYAWSFEGTAWADREANLAHLRALGLPCHLTFRDDWAGSDAYDAVAYCALLDSTKIAPVPAGNNVETFRMWEAIEHGCIPLYVRTPGDDTYWAFISERLPIFAATSWELAANSAKMLLGNDAVLDMYRADLVAKWSAWKSELQTAVRAWIA